MILGIGIDLVDIRRIEHMINRFGDRAIKMVYAPSEQKAALRYQNPKARSGFFAKRFAAKEAFAKACGLGFRQKLTFSDIVITNDHLGKPEFLLSPKLQQILEDKFQSKIKADLSLADEYPFAEAFVVLSVQK